MKEYMIYILMGIIILLVAFLMIRIVLQMIFIKRCPQCNRRVSLVESKVCPKCGYDFKANKDPKFRITVTLLILAILGIGAFDVYSFRQKSEAYQETNPYINVGSIAKEDNTEEIPTEEMGTEQTITTEQTVTEQEVPQPAEKTQ